MSRNYAKSRKSIVHSARFRSRCVVCALVLLLLAISGTLAYLRVDAPAVVNGFDVADIPAPSIEETFDEPRLVKEHVSVSLSDQEGVRGSMYVRAVVLYNLTYDDGSIVGQLPAEGTDYTVTMNTTDWQLMEDGYWYFKGTVLPGGSTEELITACTTLNETYHLTVDILAQTVQAVPAEAVQQSWGMAYSESGWAKAE